MASISINCVVGRGRFNHARSLCHKHGNTNTTYGHIMYAICLHVLLWRISNAGIDMKRHIMQSITELLFMFCSYSVDYSKAWSNHAVRIRYIWSIWFISANRCIHIPDCAWQAHMNHYRQRVHWHHIKDRTGSRSPSASIIHNFITSTKPSKK